MYSSDFQYRLHSNHRLKLYCSSVTRDLLLLDSRYQAIQQSIVALDINTPQLIDIPDPDSDEVRDQVTVTLLQAGHCPGSVMFLFEGHEGTVLYTGDFRLTKQDFMSFSHLKSGTRVKNIQSLYIDTTFCIPQAMFIPSREECTDAAIDLIREWLSRGSNYIVLLQYRADIGYENLFIRFSIEFNMKIHVDVEKFKQYEKLGDMANYVTTDIDSTRIHACRKMTGECRRGQLASRGASQLPCSVVNKDCRIRKLLFSTMCFVNRVALDDYIIRINDGFCRVCYSFHSSYSEIRDAILFLRPKRAFPNVVASYQDGEDEQKMQKRLDEFVQLAHRCDSSLATSSYSGLGQLRKAKRKTTKQDDPASNQLLFGEHSMPYDDDAALIQKSNLCSDSIDILADMLDYRRSVNTRLDSAAPDQTEFRLLFGSPAKSCSSSNTSNDGAALIVEEPVSGSVDSSYEQSNSEGIDLCGSLEGMTQDDQDVMKNYAAECKPILFYLSEGENGDCNIEKSATVADNHLVETTSVPQVFEKLAERSDNENKGEALVDNCENSCLQRSADTTTVHHRSFSAMECGKITAVDCGKRARNSDVTDNGINGDVIDTHPYRKKRKSLKVINEDFSTNQAYNPEQLHDEVSVENLDVIVIADDDEAEPVYMTKASPGSKGFSSKLHSIGSQGVDSDTTTVDVTCSPCKFDLAVSSPHNNHTTISKLPATCFDSDATTVDNTSPVNLISPVKVSDDGSSLPPELTSFNQSSLNSPSCNVSGTRDTASSADDLLIYLDSPQVSETSRWASWSSVQATCSTEYPDVQSLSARKKRKCQKFIKSSNKTAKETKFCDDYSDVTYEADSESDLNQVDDDEVYLPEFRFKRLQLARRVSPPTSSDSDDDVTHEYARTLVFDRSFKRSPCSSPWSSWSNEDVGQLQNARLCGSDSEARQHVVLISDDEETSAQVNVMTSGCARMLTVEDISSTVPSCLQATASGNSNQSSSCSFTDQRT